jgi:hypothetical protein
MLNLTTSEQKNTLRKEYATRQVVVWLGMFVVVLAISIVLLSPSYFLARIRAEAAKVELETAKRTLDAKLPPAEMVSEIQAAVRTAQDLRPLTAPRSVYELIKIFESNPQEIKINSIAFVEKTPDGLRPAVVTVEGWALDRESLTLFGRTLENRVEFASVDLPVSNFVKERNIDFVMTITLK